MFLKTIVVVLLGLIVFIATAISICNPDLIQVDLKPHHVATVETTSSEPLIISDPATILILAAAFLITAMFLGILLIIVALRTR